MTFLLYLAIFAVGFVAGFMLISWSLHVGIRNGTTAIIDYSKRRDRWDILGDLPAVYGKMRSHHKEPNQLC